MVLKIILFGLFGLLISLSSAHRSDARSTDRTLPGDIRLTYSVYRNLLLSDPSIMHDLHSNGMNILDMWRINIYGKRKGFGETKINKLPVQKPTGQPAFSYKQYRALLLSYPELIKNLHKYHLTISDIWKVNGQMQLGEYKYQLWASRSHQRIVYFENGLPKYIFKCCTGKFGDRYGLYWVDYKQVLHRSKGIEGCEDVPMPFALHFDNARFVHSSLLVSLMGIKGDSHGCVRQYCQNAIMLYGLVQYKTQFCFTA